MELQDTSKIVHQDEMLRMDFLELKNQLEENELVYGILNDGDSSFYIPKDPSFFKAMRRFKLNKLLHETTDRHNNVIGDIIKIELESCEKFEYQSKSLPLLIRQFTENRINMIVNMKRMIMLRFKRYCCNSQLVNEIKDAYFSKIKDFNEDYKLLCGRLSRLKSSEESSLLNTDVSIEDVTNEDIIRYLQWLLFHLNSLKFLCFLVRVIKWSPVKFNKAKLNYGSNESESIRSERSSRYISVTETITYNSESKSVLKAKYPDSSNGLTNRSSHTYNSSAAGGGLAVDERNLKIPLHTNQFAHWQHLLIHLCHSYAVDMDIKKMKTSADEMELYGLVSRRFKTVFSIQEQMRTFKVYDSSDAKSERWGTENPNRALLKTANWLEENSFVPKTNLIVSSYLNELRSDDIRDEFLITASFFIKQNNCEEMQNKLRHHALLIQHMPLVQTTNVVTNPHGISASNIFKSIYVKQNFNITSFQPSVKSKTVTLKDEDNYDFSETMAGLGLNDNIESKDDSSTVQGAFLSYLNLRILKIRDLQRTCLSLFNYFRSIERTLLINSIGYPKQSMNDLINKGKPKSKDNIGNHNYVYDSTNDYKIKQETFMSFDEVVNHDDFYFHEEGRIHLKDQKGQWIMYDVAIKDFEALEDELILIASHFINADKELRYTSLFKRKKAQEESDQNNFYVSEYGHREVDRYGILYDIWSHHIGYMEVKKKLIDICMEVYNMIYTDKDKKRLTKLIINLIYQKPRIDITDSYFISSYRLESMIIVRLIDIFRKILREDFHKFRELNEKVLPQVYPYNYAQSKLMLAIHTDVSSIATPYFFEFCSRWAMFYNLFMSIENAISTYYMSRGKALTVIGKLKEELLYLDGLYDELDHTFLIYQGDEFEQDLKDNIFATSYLLESPESITNIAQQYLKSIETRNVRGDKKTRRVKLMNEFGRLLELITVRYRLSDCLLQCEYLRSIYIYQANLLGYNDYHYHMKLQPFETYKSTGADVASRRPLLYTSSIQDDDSGITKHIPFKMSLAIKELDEKHFGKFDFSSIASVIQMLESNGLENLKLTLKVEIAHKDALSTGILLCDVCKPSFYDASNKNKERKSNSSNTAITSNLNIPVSAQSGPKPLALDATKAEMYHISDSFPEAFFSLQLEKTLVRDRILDQFSKKFTKISKMSDGELLKAKYDSITQFINGFFDRINQAILRAQIIAYYNSIILILKDVPDISKDFFQFGKLVNLSNESNLPVQEYVPNYRVASKRPKRVLSLDGEKLLNIWYIPHFTELLYCLRQSDDIVTAKFLERHLKIVVLFHDILHYLIGFYKLGISSTKVTAKLKDDVTLANDLPISKYSTQYIVHYMHQDNEYPLPFCSDYNDTTMYQLKKELTELDSQIKLLGDMPDVETVIQLLTNRRNYHYFYFQVVTEYYLTEISLACNDEELLKYHYEGLNSSTIILRNYRKNHLPVVGLEMPETYLENSKDYMSQMSDIFPWRNLIQNYGPFTVNFDTYTSYANTFSLCLAGIPKAKRCIIHYAFYNMNLILEEMNLEYFKEKNSSQKVKPNVNEIFLMSKKFEKFDPKIDVEEVLEKKSSKANDSKLSLHSEKINTYLSIRENATELYELYIYFLKLIKQSFILKYLLSQSFYKFNQIKSHACYRSIIYNFRIKYVFPFFRKISIDISNPLVYFLGPTCERDLIVCPKDLSLYSCLSKLIVLLQEQIEIKQIETIRRTIRAQIDRAIKQRTQEQFSNKDKAFKFEELKLNFLESNMVINLRHGLGMFKIIDESKHDKSDNSNNVNNLRDKVTMRISEENRENEPNESIMSQDSEIIVVKRKTLNNVLQQLSNSILQSQKDYYENYAMYFENQIKFQQTMIRMKNREIEKLQSVLDLKDQSDSVEKQFIMADHVSRYIKEVNWLRGYINQYKLMEEDRIIRLRKQYLREARCIVLNMHNVGFDLVVRIKTSNQRFLADVLHRINKEKTHAATEMSRIKEKSGTKLTADDELAHRNVNLSGEIMKVTVEGICLNQLMLRMKGLFNWIFNYAQMIQNIDLQLKVISVDEEFEGVVLSKADSKQKIKLMNSELKRLRETLTVANKTLSDLKLTLNNELKNKNQFKQGAETIAIKIEQSIEQKNKRIKSLIQQLTVLNAKLSTMQMECQQHQDNRKTVFFSSFKKVEQLKKELVEEQINKKSAFLQVDQLISQVYEFESALALMKNKKEKENLKAPKPKSNLWKPKNPITKAGKPCINAEYPPRRKPTKKTTYKTIVSRYNLPYTSTHFLPFRRDRMGIQQVKNRISKELDNPLRKSTVLFLPKLKPHASVQHWEQ